MAQAKKIDPEILKNRQLFLLNPYLKQVAKVEPANTNWEEVVCAGYNPYYQRLEAVVHIKEAAGYNGGLCSNGSREYLRFFVDFHDGAGFLDMGYTNFKVADIPDTQPGPKHPLSYSGFLYINDTVHKKFLDCEHAVVPILRVVLSWNSVPTGDPNQHPFYGNHLDVDIQLARRPYIIWNEVVEATKLKEMAKLVDPKFEIPMKAVMVEKTETIYKLNNAAGVPLHRTFYSTVGSKINSTLDFSKASAIYSIANLADYNFDLAEFYDFFNGAGENADVTYEELTCVGLNSQTDRLSAVIHIKKSSGFSGNLCTSGSNEHVAFWVDWNNNGTWDQYIGTVTLNVHDIVNIPAGGLYYTVQLPINTANRLRICSNPNIIRIRAVLSWESLPSTTNPNQLNSWGNYKDVLVQLRPASQEGSGIYSAIYYVGNVDRTMIDPGTYLFNSSGTASIYANRPWGGLISFAGIIDRNGFAGVVKYRLLWKKAGAADSSYQPVSTTETFIIDNINDPAPPYPVTESDPEGWYTYLQDPVNHIFSTNNLLANWDATTKADGAYTIQFVHTDELMNEVIADVITIIVNNDAMSVSPTANTTVDFGSDLDLVIDGGDCHSYTSAASVISGHLRVIHPYFASWALELQPTSHTHGVVPVPVSRSVGYIGDDGDSNAVWNLDTKPLDPCGYTVSLSGHSRVILNSSPGNFPYYGPKAVGFAKLP